MKNVWEKYSCKDPKGRKKCGKDKESMTGKKNK
jgi:hypothetical protein